MLPGCMGSPIKMIEQLAKIYKKEYQKDKGSLMTFYLDMAVAYNQARFTDIQQDYYYEEHYGHSVAGGSVAMYDNPRDLFI